MTGKRIPVAILGATGAVGQRMVQLLESHPWFEIAVLTGSDRTIGRPYGELVRWILDTLSRSRRRRWSCNRPKRWPT